MPVDRTLALLQKLCSEDLEDLARALTEIEENTELLQAECGDTLLAGVLMLFRLDTFDFPHLESLIERAEKVVASLGPAAVPAVLAHMEDSDINVHEHLARTLTRIGMPALKQVVAFHDACPDPMGRVFALYALSKIRDPGIKAVLPLAIRGMSSNHQELRDTATRSLGKMVSVVPPEEVSSELKQNMFETVSERAEDPVPGVRAKGMRTLGKLGFYGYLNGDQLAEARRLMHKALGHDDISEADSEFIVRREAEIALTRLDRPEAASAES
jgi:hypothetical protein